MPPTASTEDFEGLSAPEAGSLEEGRIVLRNPEESVAAVGARVDLSALQKVYVELSVNCPVVIRDERGLWNHCFVYAHIFDVTG